MFAHMLVPRFPISAAWPIDQDQGHQLAFPRLHQRERFVTLIHRAEATRKQGNRIRMPNEDQLARKKILKRDELLILANNWVGALLPWQANVRPETFFRSGPLVTRLHDATSSACNDHETRLGNFPPELDPLLIFHPRRLRARGAEDRHLPNMRIG